jgi:hypothetical protein
MRPVIFNLTALLIIVSKLSKEISGAIFRNIGIPELLRFELAIPFFTAFITFPKRSLS